MPRVHLVRHARPVSTWADGTVDPGLDDEGRRQAARLAESLAHLGPLPVVVSPLRRTRETASPLAARWAVAPRIDHGVAELRAPRLDPRGRSVWLRDVMAGTWDDVPTDLVAWRAGVLGALAALDEETVVVTHFVVVNVVVGAARGVRQVRVCAPDHVSRTVVDVDADGTGLRVVELGAQLGGGPVA